MPRRPGAEHRSHAMTGHDATDMDIQAHAGHERHRRTCAGRVPGVSADVQSGALLEAPCLTRAHRHRHTGRRRPAQTSASSVASPRKWTYLDRVADLKLTTRKIGVMHTSSSAWSCWSRLRRHPIMMHSPVGPGRRRLPACRRERRQIFTARCDHDPSSWPPAFVNLIAWPAAADRSARDVAFPSLAR